MGDPIPKGKGNFFWGSISAHYKVMEHSVVSCAKTAEPIDMPFWMKTLVGPRNYVLHGGCRYPTGRAISGVFLPLTMHCNTLAANNVMPQQTGLSVAAGEGGRGSDGNVQHQRRVHCK